MSAPTTPAPPGPADGSRFARLAPAFPVEVRPGKESVMLPTRLRCAAAALFALCLSLPTLAQSQDTGDPPTATVSLYRVAPGKHMDLLKWMAAREAIARDAGQHASQWYVHMHGDSWDSLVLPPTSSEETDKRAAEFMTQRSTTEGFNAIHECTRAMTCHTKTN